MTQNTRLLAALKNKPMTTLQIIRELGILRAASRVAELRDSHNIETMLVKTSNRFGDTCRVARYIYHS